MELLYYVKQLQGQTAEKRREIIQLHLSRWGVPYEKHAYETGVNLFVEPLHPYYLGISCHYDVVAGSPGANDNASAIAVALEMVRRNQVYYTRRMGLQVFFFDEEELQLRGSRTFLEHHGLGKMIGLINLEMVGQGDRLALWSLDGQASGRVLNTFEAVAAEKGAPTERYDRIVTNYADHIPFREAGLADAFTVTCISGQDREVAKQYYQALDQGASVETLRELMAQAPLFRHYHQPTDLSEHLSEQSLQMTADVLWETIVTLDGELP
jgi:Zn-dependent M28 family amino/carboxypeptidase